MIWIKGYSAAAYIMQKDTKTVGVSVMASSNELRGGDAGLSASESESAEAGQWACMYCGYVYDEALGDPDNGIPPGTRMEDLPEDWCCPMCSADKADFTKL